MIPLTLLSLALTAGGALANGAADNRAAKARSAALDAERIRQQGFEKRQTALAQQGQDQMAEFTPDQEERRLELADYYAAPVDTDANVTAGMVAPEGTSSITVREMANQSAQAGQRADQNAQSLAAMRSFGDLLGDRMRGIGRNSAMIDQLTGFRRGSMDANTFEVDAAMQKGAGMRTLGDILGGLGSVTGGYASMAGAGNPVVTNMLDKWAPGGDRLAAALRGGGLNGVVSQRGLLG